MSMPSLALQPSAIAKQLKRILAAGLVGIVRSSPGLGKSEIIHFDIAQKAGLKVMDFRLGQADITDLNGLPRFTPDGRAEYAAFTDFPLEGDPLPINPETGEPYNGWLLFFDEITSAPKQLQAAAYKILLERKIGQHKLHEKVWMVAAGNLETDMAVTHGMSTALQSRLVHLEMKVDKNDWVDWAIRNEVDSRILAFIEFKPGLLHDFDPGRTDRTFACPRTWKFVDALVNGKELSIKDDLPLIAGTIGPGVAQEFIQFTRIFDTLPKVSEIEANPEGIIIPVEPSTRYAIAVMLSEHFSEKNAGALMSFVKRMPVEARVLCMRMVAHRKPNLIRHPALAEGMQALARL